MEIHLPIKNGIKNSVINSSRENVKKEIQERRRNILHLILKYLSDCNLISTAETLQNEAQLSGSQYQVCENIDLEIILEEYQSYYQSKFQKQPKILRKIGENEEIKKKINNKKMSATNNNSKEKNSATNKISDEKTAENFKINVLSLSTVENNFDDLKESVVDDDMKKNLINFNDYTPEWRELADQIAKQIVPKNLGVKFEDCIGLEDTIETLKEAIVYPLQYPELFSEINPWRGVLLHGPPGTGKTLLAKALACQTPSTVINVTSSVFISKWRGESEKMLKVLFDVAKLYAPTTIYIDEIDALVCNNHDSNHEASRRFRSELLIQIDGILINHQKHDVFVLASTNNPWNLSQAVLRRFEKRILVPLPCRNTRTSLIQHYSQNDKLIKGQLFENILDHTEYFSGCDIKSVCKEAKMIKIREKLKNVKSQNGIKHKLILNEITENDIIQALQKIKPTIGNKAQYMKYLEWSKNHGAS